MDLYRHILNVSHGSSVGNCLLVACDGSLVSFDLCVLSNLLSEDFKHSLQSIWNCEDIFLSVEGASLKSLDQLRTIIYTGSCEIDELSEFFVLKRIIQQLELNIVIQPVETEGVQFHKYFSHEDPNENQESSNSFQVFLPKNVSLDEEEVGPLLIGKEIKESSCSKGCKGNCDTEINSWDDDSKCEIVKYFKEEDSSSISVKNKLMQHLTSQFNFGAPTSCYVIRNHKFCLGSMSVLLGVSVYILKKVLQDYQHGQRIYRHGLKGGLRKMTSPTIAFICWLKQFWEVGSRHYCYRLLLSYLQI